MNDLTKEARARAYDEAMKRGQQVNSNALQNLGLGAAHFGNALADANAGPRYGNKPLNPDRPLTGKPGHYLTGYEGSRCDLIDALNINQGHIEEARTGINLDKINRVSDEYRKISDEVDNEIGE